MKYPLGIQTFSKIINDGAIYVDKTAIIYELITQGSIYFLSRPDGFGKSLLVSTFESLFKGKKELFKDLDIAKTDYAFTPHVVVLFEFSNVQVSNADDLKNYIINVTNEYAQQYDIELTINSYEQRFTELIKKLEQSTKQSVVLLVDEYDKPILDNLLGNQLPAIKDALNGFYSVVKQLDKHFRFVFITGVSKFSKVSVFSGMNSLTDITLHKRYAALCGITEHELLHYFAAPIKALANELQTSEQQLLEDIKHWYNGYHFHQQGEGVYNPYSLLSLFAFEEFQNFWYSTATPSFLIDLIEQKQYDLSDLSNLSITASAFANAEPENLDVLSLFVQTGYLTIKGFKGARYQLGFPNYEVKRSFFDSIATRYSRLENGVGDAYIYDLVDHINEGDLDAFFAVLKRFFANIPYDLLVENREKYYQSLLYAVLTLIGLDIKAEISTNIGRIDCVLETAKRIYIVEFKLDGTKENALEQIIDNQYADKYLGGSKEVVLLGVEFSQSERNIGGYLSRVG